MKKLTAEEYYDHYQVKKRKTTLNNWKRNLNVEIDLEEFDEFKEQKKKYLKIKKIIEECKSLNPKFLKQLLKKQDILELLNLFDEE